MAATSNPNPKDAVTHIDSPDFQGKSKAKPPGVFPVLDPQPPRPTPEIPLNTSQALAEEIYREQTIGTMVVCKTPKVFLKLAQMKEVIALRPTHPIAIVYAKAIRGFPDSYKKTFHVEKPDLDALLQGRYVRKDIVVDEHGDRIERKILVDSPVVVPNTQLVASSPQSVILMTEEEGISQPVSMKPPRVEEGTSKPVSQHPKPQSLGIDGQKKTGPVSIKPSPQDPASLSPDHEIVDVIKAAQPKTKPKATPAPQAEPEQAKKTAKKKTK